MSNVTVLIRDIGANLNEADRYTIKGVIERQSAKLHVPPSVVHLTVRDINGPKGGCDRTATVSLIMSDGQIINAKAQADTNVRAARKAAKTMVKLWRKSRGREVLRLHSRRLPRRVTAQ